MHIYVCYFLNYMEGSLRMGTCSIKYNSLCIKGIQQMIKDADDLIFHHRSQVACWGIKAVGGVGVRLCSSLEIVVKTWTVILEPLIPRSQV